LREGLIKQHAPRRNRNGQGRVSARKPLILCYHAVSSSWPVRYATTESALKFQLAFLERQGYVGVTFAEAERRRQAGTLPERSVVVTFDDGFLSTLHAKPLLDEVGFPATVFVVTDFVESGAPLDWDGMDGETWLQSEHAGELEPLGWDHLAVLAAAGWEVGSHTLRHPNLLHVDSARLERELHESRAVIAARLGRCETVAYPFGYADRRVAEIAAAAGYLAGCTLVPLYDIDQQYLRPRVGISPSDTGLKFAAKVSPFVHAWRRSSLGRSVDSIRWSIQR
jgi:peptidoglycan/xylan/chitin deacetylase (PgdA/CDA1 family)